MHRQIAPGVIVVDTKVADGKAGVIAGERVALAVDAGIDDDEGTAVLDAARSLGRTEVALAYTHGHADHVLGGTAFAGRPIYARVEVAGHMRSQLQTWANRSGEPAEALGARLGWPTRTFERETEVEIGGRSVLLLDAPGHAPGAVCVFDRQSGVLFGGDTIVTAIPPAFSDGDSLTLERTLRRIADLEIRILVPGHGAEMAGTSVIREAILWSADYLAACREHVARNASRPVEEIVARAPYAAYVGDRLPRDRFRMQWRHEQTVRRMCLEAGLVTRHV
jgi:glyoxylase-like metal-dependent hydrolase (beta-lactamase superfamily II)